MYYFDLSFFISEGNREIYTTQRSTTLLDRTQVRFRDLHEHEIHNYVAREQPLDCAGAFKAEGLGIALFASIHSDDPSALIGLPLIKLCTLLSQFGIEPLANSNEHN